MGVFLNEEAERTSANIWGMEQPGDIKPLLWVDSVFGQESKSIDEASDSYLCLPEFKRLNSNKVATNIYTGESSKKYRFIKH